METRVTDSPKGVVYCGPGSSDSLEDVSEMVMRMKSGAPIVRYSEIGKSGASSKPEVHMCYAYLNDALDQIVFVAKGGDSPRDSPVSVIALSKVEQVEASNLDQFAVALLLPEDMQISELIFATEEDWHAWLAGLKVLCARLDTPVQGDRSTEPSAEELYAIVGELMKQNEVLKRIKEEYEHALSKASKQLHSQDEEIRNLKSLLELRDETIRDLTESVHSLSTKQSILSAKLAAHYSVPPRPAHVPSGSSKSTTGSFEFGVKGLENLEQQLKKLDERKRQLELLLSSAGGA